MIQINLIPDVKLELVRAQRNRNLVISVATLASAVTIGLVILTAIYVFGVQFAREKLVDTSIDERYTTLKEIDDIGKMVTIQNQLAQIDQTHSNKPLTSRIFSLLAVASAKGTDNSVSITTFDVNKSEETITLTAKTDKKGFEAAEIFKKNIEALKVDYRTYDEDGKLPKLPSDNESKDDKDNKSDEGDAADKSDVVETVSVASDVRLSELGTDNSSGEGAQSVTFSISFSYAPEVLDMKTHIDAIRGLSKGNVTDSYTRLPSDLFTKTQKAVNSGEQE